MFKKIKFKKIYVDFITVILYNALLTCYVTFKKLVILNTILIFSLSSKIYKEQVNALKSLINKKNLVYIKNTILNSSSRKILQNNSHYLIASQYKLNIFIKYINVSYEVMCLI